MIADGNYDVFVVDATSLGDEGDPAVRSTAWRLELTILTGEHKGDVVSVNASGLERSEFDLVGMPGTLRVVDGHPAFTVDT